MSEPTYRIVRIWQNDDQPRIPIATGQTLEQAQAHCSSPDSSSETAPADIVQAMPSGTWMDCFFEE